MSNLVIATNIAGLNTHRSLKTISGKAEKASEKLSSGFKINRAADDAAGLAISEKMRNQIRGLNMASKNCMDGISLVNTAEGAISEISEMVKRMRELAVQSANDTNTFEDREKIDQEIIQLRREINATAGRTEFNTKKLLRGDIIYDAETGEPAMNTGQVQYPVANVEDLRLTGVGYNMVYVSAPENVTDTLWIPYADDDNFIQYTDKEVPPDITSWEDILFEEQPDWKYVPYSSVTPDPSKIPAPDLNRNCYFVGEGGEYLVMTPPVDPNLKVLVDKDNNPIYWPIGPLKPGGYIDVKAEVLNVIAPLTDVEFDDFLADINTPDVYPLPPRSVDEKYAYFSNVMKTAINSGLSKVGIGHTYDFKITPDGKFTHGFTDGYPFEVDWGYIYSNGIGDFITGIAKNSNYPKKTDRHIDVFIQSGANKDQGIMYNIGSMDLQTLGLVGIRCNPKEKALEALERIDLAVEQINSVRAKLGAYVNRTEHTVANLDVASENLTSAESRIRDTDMAREMMEFTKANILSQAGMAMLAQANQQPNQVLSLVR